MAEIPCPLDVAADRFGEESAIVTQDRTYTFRDYCRLVAGVQERLTRAGLNSGSRVVTLADNTLEHVLALVALVRMGAVACPVSPRFPEPIVGQTIAGLQPDLIIAQGGPEGVVPTLPRLRLEDVAGAFPGSTVAGRASLNLDHDATVVLSSGSSGMPKAAVLTAGNHYFSALGANENMALGPGDRWLLSLPLYHVGGLGIVTRALLAGAAVVIPPPGMDLSGALDCFRPTHLSLVPTQLYRLLHDHNLTLSATTHLKAILLGGGPVRQRLLREALERSLPVHTSYGLTETASQVTATRAGESLGKLLTSGRVLPYREIGAAADGEIVVRGATLFRGYYGSGAVSKVVDKNGWWATGDLGRVDSDGYLTVLGRKDNMFVSGGENIHPEEIETVLCDLDAVVDALVVPVSDLEYGHRPVAFVRWRGASLADDRVREQVRQRLPGIKVPVAFYEWPETTTATELKPTRRQLIELAQARMGKSFNG